MKPLIHAKSSVRKYGGDIDDYIDIHEWMDQTKACMPDVRHRAILHSSLGIYLAQDRFGIYRKNSSGKDYSVRDIAEDHVIEDLGFIPTVEQYLNNMTLQPWMSGTQRSRAKHTYEELGRNPKHVDVINEVMQNGV